MCLKMNIVKCRLQLKLLTRKLNKGHYWPTISTPLPLPITIRINSLSMKIDRLHASNLDSFMEKLHLKLKIPTIMKPMIKETNFKSIKKWTSSNFKSLIFKEIKTSPITKQQSYYHKMLIEKIQRTTDDNSQSKFHKMKRKKINLKFLLNSHLTLKPRALTKPWDKTLWKNPQVPQIKPKWIKLSIVILSFQQTMKKITWSKE